jgi:ferredoxin
MGHNALRFEIRGPVQGVGCHGSSVDAMLSPAREPTRLPEVNAQRCTGCGRCVGACQPHALSLETLRWKKTSVLHAAAACTGCGACAPACPFDAIRMVKRLAASG